MVVEREDVARDIYIGTRERVARETGEKTDGTHDLAFLHGFEGLGNGVAHLDAGLLEVLGGCPQARVFFDAGGQLHGEEIKTMAERERERERETDPGTLVHVPRTLHGFRVLELVDVSLELLDVVLQLAVLS